MSDALKGALKSKTLWFNLLTLLAAIFALDEIKLFISADTLLQIQAAVNIVLRVLTWQALSNKV